MKKRKFVWVLLTLFCMLFTFTGCADLSSAVEYLEYIEYAEEVSSQEEVSREVQEEKVQEEAQEEKVQEETVQEEEAQQEEVQEEAVQEEEAQQEDAQEELSQEEVTDDSEEVLSEDILDRDGSYTTAEDVALYLHLYGELPRNFMTKNDARDLGWEGGSLEKYAPGMCIGGDRFGNYEGVLPKKKGRSYQECDIDTLGAKSRGAKRIVFSNDGLIYYTDDHYETFTLLYGEE